MSVRAVISGFDLRKMTALIGCGNPGVAGRVEAYLRTKPENRDVWPEYVDPIVERLRQVVLGDLKRGSIELEEPALVDAMIELARFDQKHLETDSAIWRSAHLLWALDLPAHLEGAEQDAWTDARTLVHYAVVERPIFGSHQEYFYESGYGYLSLDEVQRLLTMRQRFPRLGEDESGFASAFFGWLAEIAAAGRDYWFYSQ
jgi:hypothetical protein